MISTILSTFNAQEKRRSPRSKSADTQTLQTWEPHMDATADTSSIEFDRTFRVDGAPAAAPQP